MHTLVEAADQIEGSLLAEEGEELEKVVFPECGEIFTQSRYKVTVHAFVAKKPTQVVGEEKITSTGELRDEEEPEVERIPNVEARECDQLQAHPQGVVTQEPTTLEMFVEAVTQLEVSVPEVETIPDLNLGVFTMTPEQSQDIELVEGEFQQQENVEVD